MFLFFGWYDLQRTGWAQSVPSISVGHVVGPDCWMLYLCPLLKLTESWWVQGGAGACFAQPLMGHVGGIDPCGSLQLSLALGASSSP